MKKIALFLSLILALTLAGCSVKTIGSPLYTVSGQVVARGNVGVEGVSLKIGDDVVATTDAEGKYTLNELEGAKTLTAVKSGYTFAPKQIKLSYARTDADFNATVINTDEPDEPEEPDPPTPPVKTVYPIAPYEKYAAPEKTDAYALYDTFENGIKPDGPWELGNARWSSNPIFKGAFPHNVAYTEDGTLILRSKGVYYPDPDKRGTSAVIVSKERFGPGVYEMSMKIAPRLGVCTAVWPLYNDGKSNHEVDIEFPGHPDGADADRGLDWMMSTTWTTEGNYRTNQVNLVEKGVGPANNGEWHKFKIDWRTVDVDPSGPNGGTSVNQIEWYVDDIKVSTITGGTVARIAGQLWIGTWMPNNWAGPSNFENADLLLDWVTYKPYQLKAGANTGSDSYKTPMTTKNPDAYPSQAVTLNEYNWISDGDFKGNKDAWQRNANNDLGAHEVFLDYLGKEKAFRFKNNATISQKIDATYAGYTYQLNADFAEHVTGSTFTIKAEFIDNYNNVKGSYLFDPQLKENVFSVPKGAKNIRIVITSSGTGTIDLKNIELFRTWAEAEEVAA